MKNEVICHAADSECRVSSVSLLLFTITAIIIIAVIADPKNVPKIFFPTCIRISFDIRFRFELVSFLRSIFEVPP